MAFMVPLVKNHYDIYARNNPADHGPSPASKANNNSLYLSATSLKSGAPVTKQYRIVLTGAKGAKPAGPKKAGAKSASAAGLTQSNGKLYYRMPSASISLPVVRGSGTGRVIPKKKDGVVTTTTSADNSPQSVSPPSRPLPHVRRTVRNPLTNRVYSYSVSIPDYVAEEAEEDLLEEDEDLEIDLDLEDKENNQAALLFSTSAPGGTGPIAGTPTPPPSKALPAKKKPSKSAVTPSHSLPGSPDGSHPLGPCARPVVTRTHSSASASSTGSNSREYVELLRKFVLHLKMLKIGGGSKKSKKITDPEGSSPTDDANNNKPAQQRARKRKDTMEDSKHL